MVPAHRPPRGPNPFRIAQIQFDMAAEFLKLDPGLRQIFADAQARAGSFHAHEDGQRPGE